MFNIHDAVLEAEKRITPYVRKTPLDYSLALSRQSGVEVFLKCENLQYTGAFKVRGAFNKLLQLTPEQRQKGVIAASTGNHGTAVAFGLSQLKIPGRIFLPENVSPAKVDNMKNYQAQLEFYGRDCVDTEVYARAHAEK